MPGGREAPEMIQAHGIHMCQKRPQTIDAPAVTGVAHSVPVIDGIAPELPREAEIIRRNTRDKTGPVLLVEQEQLRVRPDIARIGGHEKGQVADEVQTS
jgi:hypothetical protein